MFPMRILKNCIFEGGTVSCSGVKSFCCTTMRTKVWNLAPTQVGYFTGASISSFENGADGRVAELGLLAASPRKCEPQVQRVTLIQRNSQRMMDTLF